MGDIGKAFFIKRGADGFNVAVHHIGRSDNIGAGFGVGYRNFG